MRAVMNNFIAPLPEQVRAHLENNTHPGLWLDKYVESCTEDAEVRDKLQEHVQKPAVNRLVELSREAPPGLDLDRLLARRDTALRGLDAVIWECETTAPLALHLAHASALENAGICLHPIYGFTYLPGSGLKGMARSFAETVWCAGRADKAAAWETIEAVFGWAPHSDDGKSWKPDGLARHGRDDSARVGGVVFHDAWPVAWPRLLTDITNNHHAKYYQGKGAPGDWEGPIPVYFPAVALGLRFSFALSTTRRSADQSLVDLAKEWLIGALCHMGAGAKTAAGYGDFRPCEGAAPDLDAEVCPSYRATLELVTPAFLAGAKQEEADCDLRSGTVRGLLRWWWRTLHAGHVDVPTLRAMEATIWGNTEAGGAVRTMISASEDIIVELYDYKDGRGFGVKPDFKGQHVLDDPPRKTTQGLWYHSYGMNEKKSTRWYAHPGSKWELTLSARNARFRKSAATREIPAAVILEQARTALWLLCRFGGAGSKSRKGFGSFADLADFSVEKCKAAGKEFRDAYGVLTASAPRDPETPSLEHLIRREIPTPWKDCWFALDQVGFSAQSFAQQYKHSEEKQALGLPRPIHGPTRNPLRDQDHSTHRPPIELRSQKGKRYAAPVHYHLAKASDDTLIVRVIAFPARYLPDSGTSRALLERLIAHLEIDLSDRFEKFARLDQRRPSPPPRRPPAMPNPGDKVQAVLVEEKTKKGGWKAKHKASRLIGPIQNTTDMPADKQSGEEVSLIVAIAKPRTIAFRWPTPAGEARAAKKRSNSSPRLRGRNPHGGRR